MPLTSAMKDLLVNHFTNVATFTPDAQLYIALHTADPGATGANNEVAGGSYARQAAPGWTTSSGGNGATSNTANVEFLAMPAVTVTHGSFWTAASGGNCRGYGALVQSKTVASGETLRLNTGDIDFTLT